MSKQSTWRSWIPAMLIMSTVLVSGLFYQHAHGFGFFRAGGLADQAKLTLGAWYGQLQVAIEKSKFSEEPLIDLEGDGKTGEPPQATTPSVPAAPAAPVTPAPLNPPLAAAPFQFPAAPVFHAPAHGCRSHGYDTACRGW